METWAVKNRTFSPRASTFKKFQGGGIRYVLVFAVFGIFCLEILVFKEIQMENPITKHDFKGRPGCKKIYPHGILGPRAVF